MIQTELGLNLWMKSTRKRELLDEMDRGVPWAQLIALIEPHYQGQDRASAHGHLRDAASALSPTTVRVERPGHGRGAARRAAVLGVRRARGPDATPARRKYVTLPSFPGSLNRALTRPAFAGRQAICVGTASG